MTYEEQVLKNFDELFCKTVGGFVSAKDTGECHLTKELLKVFISSALKKQREYIIDEVKGNHHGTFTDEGGNDCWYIDDLVKMLTNLKNKGL